MAKAKKSVKKVHKKQPKQKKDVRVEKAQDEQVLQQEQPREEKKAAAKQQEQKQAPQEDVAREEKKVEEKAQDRPTPAEEPAREEKKTIDQEWKEQAQQEKKEARQEGTRPHIPEPNFMLFVSGLASQTLIALGQIENPFTKQKAINRDQAKYTIDTLKMIEEKTRGNLTQEEEKYLQGLLYDLRMSYISTTE